MATPELTHEQKAALIVSRMARTVAHHEAARCPVHLLDIAPDGSTRLMWAFGKWSEMENLQYVPINQELIVEVDDQH